MNRTITSVLGVLFALAPITTSAVDITHYLAVGSRGAEVSALQETLISLGFLKVSATGYFGGLTKLAVMAFQKTNGLEQVGATGPKTRALLAALIAKPTPEPVQTPSADAGTSPVQTPSAPPATTTATEPPAPIVFSVTVTAPTATLPVNTLDTKLTLKTTKPATCRRDGNPDKAFTDMKQFVNTGGTTHSSTLTGLYNGAYYLYYIQCVTDANESATTTATILIATQ